MCKNKLIKIFIVALLFLFAISHVFALDNEQNLTNEEQASICLDESKEILTELIYENFTSLRVNDSLIQAENLFIAQNILKQNKKKYDFSLVLPYCDEIKAIKQKAFEARDEFIALKRFYSELSIEGMDTQSIDEIILEIEGEMQSERYEKIEPLIEKTYEEIVNVRADYLSSNVFYKAVTRSLKQFFYENWIYFLFGLGVLFILFFIYKNTILQIMIRRKIHKLEVRKDTLKYLIRKTQREYFNQGDVSERTYNIRIKKFAELIRDIDRQIPLLNEQLFKVLKKQKSKTKFSSLNKKK